MNYQPENTNRLGSTHEHVNIKKTEVNFVISLTDLFGSTYTLFILLERNHTIFMDDFGIY